MTSAAFLGIAAVILGLLFHPAALYAGSEAAVTVFKERGGRVDWSHSGNNMIVFDKKGADGYYDVYVMRADGSGEQVEKPASFKWRKINNEWLFSPDIPAGAQESPAQRRQRPLPERKEERREERRALPIR